MTTYYHGGGEIQVDGGGDNLQTLYLMNPNSYITSTPYSDNHHHHQLLPNTTIIPQPSSNPHYQQQFYGIPLAGPHQNWSPTSEGIPTQVGLVHNSVGHTEFKSPGPHTAQGSLSLSLSPGRQQDVRMSVTVASEPEVIIRSKYLRSTQELLEEVVNVVGVCDNGASRGVDRDNKAKSAVKVDDDVVRVGHYDGTGEGASGSSNKGAELSTVHRHELQMKKAKLLNMLDEVEQRYRQYHTQMQLVASSFEQAAGIGSAKSYTSLALKTISKQFRCLKDAITSQIKSASKSLGEDDNVGRVKLEGGAGSRLRLVDQQLRQQRALQQIGMMHQHNAWRPQRGLPERAVTVLRAWLFEHFLHPYPKDSDKHMLAKQTGLTRSQVSNWFINARVRLWKPMVEEMYVEEMKSHEENGGGTSENNTNTATMNMTTTNDGGVGNFTSKIENNRDDHKATKENGAFNNMIVPTHQHEDNQQNTNGMISTISQSQGFNTLIGSSSNMETLMTSQKKQRSNNNSSNMNSPSSILSMDMEMKPIDHQHQKYVHQEHQKPHHNPSMMNTTSQIGFNPYIVNDIGRFDPGEMTPSYHGNAVSLTLGLPRCDNNLSMSDNHQQNFFPNQDLDMGRRLNVAQGEDFCGISMGQTSHSSNGYESIDIQNRKRFAAQILHDFVA